MPVFPFSRYVGYESSKAYNRRIVDGFWNRFIRGDAVLDIGYRGGRPDAFPICENAIGIELDHPYIGAYGRYSWNEVTRNGEKCSYDGLHLPFDDASQDAVHNSHVLEHVADDAASLREWWRVLRVGGHLLTFVPHAFLYERRLTVPPSRWSGEHLRCYTPATLLALVERTLPPNTYRVRHLADNDEGYDYALAPDQHPQGCLEIELVLEKIAPPSWSVEP